MVDLKDLTAVYKCGEGAEWYLAFSSSSEVDRLADGSLRRVSSELEVLMERIDQREVKFRVHWFPLHMKMELVKQFMGRYSETVKLEPEFMSYDGIRVKTGTLSGTMKCTEAQYQSIPYRAVIYNRPVLITVLGRQAVCLRCGETGHQRATCPHKNAPSRSYAEVARRSDEVANDQTEDTVAMGPPQDRRGSGAGAKKNNMGPPQDKRGSGAGERDNGPPARHARERVEKESMGPPPDIAREGAEPGDQENMGPPQDIAREGAEEVSVEQMEAEETRMVNERKRKGYDDGDDSDEEGLKKTKEEIKADIMALPIDPAVVDLTHS